MAKKDAAQSAEGADMGSPAEGAATSNGDATQQSIAAPRGFRRRSAVSEAPWFKMKVNNICHGKLLGRYSMTGMEPIRHYYQVELYKACTVTVGRGEEAEDIEAQPGDVINIGETFKLTCYRDIEVPEILAGADYDVWVHVQKKIKVSGGRTMWVIDPQSKRTKAPTGEVRPLPREEGAVEDAPF